ncbi:MAG TPA: hypothetical protein VHI55_13390 [Gaiellaceae bacterium]|jgi:hypothetical protein|nr:hypothetical protein [Gaiellaceae bacterium]
MTKSAALRAVLLEAYHDARASQGAAIFRMVGYAARRLVEERFGIPADSVSIAEDVDYALRTLDPEIRSQMVIYREERGVGYEPHTGRVVRFGTASVRGHINSWTGLQLDPPEEVEVPSGVETTGPSGRYGGVLLVEKEGLLPLIRGAGIGKRHDLMVAATRGQGVGAVKEMIEELARAHPDLPIYVLHDYDIAGLSIHACWRARTRSAGRGRSSPTSSISD